ncbi:hypothetical protein ANCCAN_28351 [Ancylostoma caninum]|uniref:PAN domain protein n=1 Tax=Ancylostoma caninum TaxID=29170 RepID=A0A368F1K7_ANCCA|nr:hypothetical protein ANCCAN_28351 [Ancylostoma caninum]
MRRITLLSLFVTSCLAYNERYAKDYGSRDYSIDESIVSYPRSVTHTFPNRTQCMELCELPCTITNVYMENRNIEMYNCVKLRPPKVIFSNVSLDKAKFWENSEKAQSSLKSQFCSTTMFP